jgi:formylglycine-generating enzyme required for sulfatase activity
LFDMHGNVAEWCLDGCRHYGPEARTDPDGGTSGLGNERHIQRALRGGCWLNRSSLCRSATRNAASPLGATNEYGCRVVRVLDGGGP